jgi:hypothetical protein
VRASELIKKLQEITEDYHTDPIIEIEERSFVDRNGYEKIASERALDVKFKRKNWAGYDAIIIRKKPERMVRR